MTKMLKFEHNDGTIRLVKERTQTQINKVLCTYLSVKEQQRYKYIPNTQEISKMNGNIYADFEYIDNYGLRLLNYDGEPCVTTLYIADYFVYINEIKG